MRDRTVLETISKTMTVEGSDQRNVAACRRELRSFEYLLSKRDNCD